MDPTVATTKTAYKKYMKNPIKKLAENIKEKYYNRDVGPLTSELH